MSISLTLGMAAYGYGIRYDYGIFTQKIENGEQVNFKRALFVVYQFLKRIDCFRYLQYTQPSFAGCKKK